MWEYGEKVRREKEEETDGREMKYYQVR